MIAFLHVQINGIIMGPVLANRGRQSEMSSFFWGVKRIVIGQDIPADISPEGL